MQTAAAGFSALSRAGTVASFTGVLGTLQIALGAFSFIKGLFGDEEVNGFEVLSMQIDQMYQRISQKLDLIHRDIQKLEARMARLERMTVKGAQEIYLMDLYSSIEKIRLDLSGEFTLDEGEKRKVALKLITWLDMHSRSPLVTGLIREDAPLETCIEILEDPSFDLEADFPLYVTIYSKLQNESSQALLTAGDGARAPSSRIGTIEYRIDEVDNLKIVKRLHEMLSLISDAWEVDVSKALERANIRKIKTESLKQSISSEISKIIAFQMKQLKFEMGKIIHKQRFEDELGDWKHKGKPYRDLFDKFKVENPKDLKKIAQDFRLKSALLFPITGTKISQEAVVSYYASLDQELYKKSLLENNVSGLEAYLQAGAPSAYTTDIHWDINPLHYFLHEDARGMSRSIFKTSGALKHPKIMELLLKAEVKPKEVAIYGSYSTPKSVMRDAIWLNEIGCVLVYASMDPDLEVEEWPLMKPINLITTQIYDIHKYIIESLRSKVGVWKRENFVKAYNFYRDIDEGRDVSPPAGIEEIPLMYLASCLGDTRPLEVLNSKVKYKDLDRLLHLAVIYKNTKVLDYLLKSKCSDEENVRVMASKSQLLAIAKSVGNQAYVDKISTVLA